MKYAVVDGKLTHVNKVLKEQLQENLVILIIL